MTSFKEISQKGKKGGVRLFLKHGLIYTIMDSNKWNVTSFEFLLVSLHLQRSACIIIGVIYRPPDTSLQLFNAEFLELVTRINQRYNHSCFLGDYNIDLLEIIYYPLTEEFYNNMISNYSLVSSPELVIPKVLLWITFVYASHLNYSARILISDISYHLPLYLSLELSGKSCQSSSTIRNRKTDRAAKEGFINRLKE